MTIAKTASFTDFNKFVELAKKLKDVGVPFNFNGNIDENGNDNFSVNWTSEEEV